MNPFLFILALVAGFGISWVLSVRKVTRTIPVTRPIAAQEAALPVAPVAVTVDPPVDPPDASQPRARRAAGPLAQEDTAPFYALAEAAAEDAPATPDPAPWRPRRQAAGLAEDVESAPGAVDPTEPPPAPAMPRRAGATSVTALGRTFPGFDGLTPPRPPSTDAPGGGGAPDGYTVKGDRKAMLYLIGGDRDYDRAHPDIWFLDERAALDAGYAHYLPKSPAEATES